MSNFLEYDNFKSYLNEQLKNNDNGEVNGFEVLYDFYLDYPPEHLEDDSSDFFHEEIDGLTQNQIDQVLLLLERNEQSWLEVKGGKLRLKATKAATKVNKSKLYQELTANEEALLKKAFSEIGSTDRKALINLYNAKVNTFGTKAEKYQVSKLIVDKLVFSGESEEEHKIFLETAGQLGKSTIEKGSYRYFEHLAKVYRSKYEHETSAAWYKEAASSASKCGEKEELILELTRNERLQYVQAGKEAEASKAFIRENDLIAKIDESKITRSIYFILKHVSDYFQNPKKVAFWAFGIILVASILFSISGITTSAGTSQSWRSEDFLSFKSLAVFGDSLYFSLVTFTTLGYGDYSPSNICSRIVANVVSMGGLLLASLFLVTLVKKYGR